MPQLPCHIALLSCFATSPRAQTCATGAASFEDDAADRRVSDRRTLLLSAPLLSLATQLALSRDARADVMPPSRTDGPPPGEEGRMFLLTAEEAQELTLAERQVTMGLSGCVTM